MDIWKSFAKFAFCLLLLADVASARLDKIPGSRYISGRGAALGDAFISLVDDGAGGLFYNPAALGLIKKTHFEPLNMQLQMNQHYMGQIGLNFFSAFSLPSYSPTLQANPGTTPGVGWTFVPNFFVRGIAFGVLSQMKVSATYVDGNIHYKSLYQVIPAIGGAVRLAQGIVRLGYSIQWVMQADGDITTPADDPDLGYSYGLKHGSAFSHTVGLGLTLPMKLLPTFNVVARNLFNATFNNVTLIPLTRDSTGVPDEEPMSIDVSASISPRFGRGGVLNLSYVDRDALGVSNFSFYKRSAFGMEFAFQDSFFIRAGWGSGYPSVGLGLRRPTAEFSLSWFSEEIGTPNVTIRDTRYIVHYQIRAF